MPVEVEEVVVVRAVESVNLIKDNPEHCEGIKFHVDLLELLSNTLEPMLHGKESISDHYI